MLDVQQELEYAFDSHDNLATQNRLLATLIKLLDERLPVMPVEGLYTDEEIIDKLKNLEHGW